MVGGVLFDDVVTGDVVLGDVVAGGVVPVGEVVGTGEVVPGTGPASTCTLGVERDVWPALPLLRGCRRARRRQGDASSYGHPTRDGDVTRGRPVVTAKRRCASRRQ